MVTSPLPLGGSPTLQSRGHNQQRPQGFKEGDKIRCGPQVGRLATSPVPSTGAPTAESVGQNQEPPTSGGLGYISPAIFRGPQRPRAGDKISTGQQVGGMAAQPRRLGSPQRLKAGDNVRSGPQWGGLAT